MQTVRVFINIIGFWIQRFDVVMRSLRCTLAPFHMVNILAFVQSCNTSSNLQGFIIRLRLVHTA
jgi:hypothetical protein